MVGAEEALEPVLLARLGEGDPVVPGHVLLALDHQADAHGAQPSRGRRGPRSVAGRARPAALQRPQPQLELGEPLERVRVGRQPQRPRRLSAEEREHPPPEVRVPVEGERLLRRPAAAAQRRVEELARDQLCRVEGLGVRERGVEPPADLRRRRRGGAPPPGSPRARAGRGRRAAPRRAARARRPRRRRRRRARRCRRRRGRRRRALAGAARSSGDSRATTPRVVIASAPRAAPAIRPTRDRTGAAATPDRRAPNERRVITPLHRSEDGSATGADLGWSCDPGAACRRSPRRHGAAPSPRADGTTPR